METQTENAKLKIIDDVKLEPTLKEAQAFVGGYVEGISFPNGDYLIINEEGKLKNLPLIPKHKHIQLKVSSSIETKFLLHLLYSNLFGRVRSLAHAFQP